MPQKPRRVAEGFVGVVVLAEPEPKGSVGMEGLGVNK